MSETPTDDADRPHGTPSNDGDPTPTDAEAPATDPSDGATTPAWRVLVPVAVLEGEDVPAPLADLLSTLPVTVLGYHVLPEQTAPGQARLQFEDRAQAKLDAVARLFREAGGDSDTRLVFTQDREESIDRVAKETGCDVVLHPNPTGDVERLLVSVGPDTDADRLVAFVGTLVGDRDLAVTLLRVVDDEAKTASARDRLTEAATELRATGVAVEESVVVAEAAVGAITDAAVDHDAVVMGESGPSLRSFVFGETAERVADGSVGPVFVVRRPDDGPAE